MKTPENEDVGAASALVHAAKMRLDDDTEVSASSGFQLVPFDTEIWDTDGFCDLANNRFLPIMGDGWYRIECHIRFDRGTGSTALSGLQDLTVMLHPFSSDPDVFIKPSLYNIGSSDVDTNFGLGVYASAVVVLQQYASENPSDWDRVIVQTITKKDIGSATTDLLVEGGSNGSWTAITYLGTNTIPVF